VNRKDDISDLRVSKLEELLREFAGIFEDRGTVAVDPEEDWMHIQLKDNADLTSNGPYNNGAKDKAVIDETFGKIHDEGKLSWAKGGATGWPAFVAWNNGKGRVVVDVRGLNNNALADAYPMPRQGDTIQGISGRYWLSIFDLRAAFLQRLIAFRDIWILTVVSHRGLETSNVALMGYKNSPAHMQRFMDRILWHLR